MPTASPWSSPGSASAPAVAAWFAVENAKRATAEAERAIRNFGIAKNTADEVVFDLAQGLRDVEGMRVDSVRTILTRAEDAMKRLAEAAPDDASVQRSQSVDAAMNSAPPISPPATRPRRWLPSRKALAISRRLAASNPDNAFWRRDIPVRLGGVGDAKLRTGDTEGAMAAYQEMLAAARTLAKTDPGNKALQRDVSVSLNKIGDVKLKTGDVAGALDAYQRRPRHPSRRRRPEQSDLAARRGGQPRKDQRM